MRAVNLIPADQRTGGSVGAGRSQGAAYALLGLFAGLAVMTLLYGIADHNIASSKKQAAALAARTQRAQAEATQLAAYTSFIAMRRSRAEAVAQLVDSRFDWAHAFHEFARVLPSDASISSLDGTIVSTTSTGAAGSSSPSAATSAVAAPKASSAPAASSSASPASSSGSAASASASSAAPVSSATPPGSVPTFTVSGCAKSQTAVAETIDRLRLIDGVDNVALQSSTKSGSSGGGAGSAGGGCAGNQAAYTLVVTYQPLPTPSAASHGETKVLVATSSTSKKGARR